MTWPSRTNEYNQHRNRMKAYGRWEPYVDAEPARQHVLELMRNGMGPVTIAKASGVPHGSISKLIYGDYRRKMAPSKRIRPATAERLLAVEPTPEHKQPGCLMPAHGTRRRLQALAFMGYPVAWIAARIGLGPAAVWRLQHGRSEQCEVATHLAIKALYREHAMCRHNSLRAEVTRRNAREKGWLSPLEWDDLDAADERTARGWAKTGPKLEEETA